MLTKRIIPCLDIKNGKVVKGINFVGLKEIGDPVELAKIYEEQCADEIVFLDITASFEEREIIGELIGRAARELSIPLTVGGGIRSINDFRRILASGADKVSINSAAIENPEFIHQAANEFGVQCVVVAIDAKANESGSSFEVYIKGGRENAEIDLVEWAKKCEKLGAGEILLTSMDKDGPNIEPRYMNSTKKHYYLASVNENDQQLIKQEIDGLTTVLIDLKSQYDIISRESIDKKLQTEELTKKIDSLQKIVKNSRNQIEDTNTRSKNLANLIKQKKTELNEGLYHMKTLISNINILKKDNFLLQKKIKLNEDTTKRLENIKQNEVLKETALAGKKNKVHSEITNQAAKNKFQEGEQRLQLQYYKTIIEQKNMFIRTDEERKERQKKLAEEAKNNSADKQEIEKRKVLCLLKLYNIYLENEMAKSIKANEEIETTYRSIREIVGSPSLKVIVDKILTKETTYNESLAQIYELEKLNEVYDKDIEQLEAKLKLLKNEQIVQQNDEKTLSTIQSNLIQENENQLINEEQKLIEEEKILKDKLLNVNLIYKKIMENIDYFIKEMKSDDEKQKGEKTIKKKI